MEWTEVNIYTTTDGIELLCSKLEDIGIKGFAIRDSADFNEFLENKNGQWDYIDEDLMGLSECETCVTVYLPSNSQGDVANAYPSCDVELQYGGQPIYYYVISVE